MVHVDGRPCRERSGEERLCVGVACDPLTRQPQRVTATRPNRWVSKEEGRARREAAQAGGVAMRPWLDGRGERGDDAGKEEEERAGNHEKGWEQIAIVDTGSSQTMAEWRCRTLGRDC